ncbi:Site-specific recombinase XerC [Agrobacterium sp. DSM 25558]|uniref:site-specific integrase n=1 Tax=Agrobacterium sp. DSM 25558 TaxID=1907665 RepID=UPI0009725682|nr:tyrosine-type recombinase/integrase [Agrobacterium sp. DSM 25558]SCX29418.1 Site-specific recombinase XerC [Agrobacterium sp. DSM 25558]
MASIGKRSWETAGGEKREAWRLSYTDSAGKRHKEQFATRAEAEARLKAVDDLDSSGQLVPDAQSKTVADAIKLYSDALDARETEGAASRMYVSNTKRQLEMHVIPALGDIKLAAATAGVFQAHADKLKADGLSAELVRKVISGVSRCMDYARRNDMVAANTAKGTKIAAKSRNDHGKVTPPSKADYDALIAAADRMPTVRSKQPQAIALRVRFAAKTGLLASEQWALQWRHVDFDGARISVVQSVDAFGKIDVTRTAAGARNVPMDRSTVADLKAWREETLYPGDDDFVFPDARGGFTRHTNFDKRIWTPLKKLAGVSMAWHGLRQFAATEKIDG